MSEGGASLLEAARHPGCEALSFLTAPVGRRPEELDQEAFARMMEAVRRTFDICLLDAPAGVGDGFRMAAQAASLELLVLHSSKVLNVEVDPQGALEMARRSRGTPRLANRILKRVRDFAQVKYDGRITKEVA